jgi:hypothetical protein
LFRYYRFLFPGLIAMVLGFRLGTIVLTRPAPVLDEPVHLKVAQQFGPGLPSFAKLRDYPSATGPFFYLLFGNLGTPFRYDLTLLRLAVFILALGNVFLYGRIAKRLLPGQYSMPALALLATAPYFGALAGVFMTEHLALFLGLAALLCYLRFSDTGRPADAVLSLLLATGSIYTRVYYLFLPISFAATSVSNQPRRWSHVLVWLLPVISLLPLALLWRGLAPPTYQRLYHPGFQWQNASSLLVWTGVFFLPWVWRELRPWHLLALLAVPVVLLEPLPGLGITRSALTLLPHPLAFVTACLLGVVGLLWLLRLEMVLPEPRIRLAALGALILVAGLLVSGRLVFERYLLPGIPLMLICARPSARPGLALAWAGLFQLPLALAHILRLAA